MKTTQSSRLKPSARIRMILRKPVVYVIAFGVMISAFIYFQVGPRQEAYAFNVGDYRTNSSGNWSTVGTWQIYNGSGWSNAFVAPSASSGDIYIQSSHTVTVSSAITANQVIVDAGGTLSIASNTLSISNGTGVDLLNNGTVEVSGRIAFSGTTTHTIAGVTTIKPTGSLTFAGGHVSTITGRFRHQGGAVPTTATYWNISATGIYQHDYNGGSVPSFTWTVGSTCDITGITTSLPGNISQNFHHVIWNCPNQTVETDQAASFKTVNGNFVVENTGSSFIFFDKQGNNYVMNIGGNMIINGGTTYICENGDSRVNITGDLIIRDGLLAFSKSFATAYGNSGGTVYITGNINISGGTLDMSQCTSGNSSKGIGKIYLSGNLTISSPGVLTESQNSRGEFFFAGSTVQTYSLDNNTITNVIDITVMGGATLKCYNRTLTSEGKFTLMASGHLMSGSPQGISLTGATGNIQVTGTRSYSNAADYTFESTDYQITGTGLPSRARNLTLNNSNNCVLTASCSVSNILTFTAGNWIASDDTLTLGTSTAILGTLSRTSGHVVGYFARWFNLTSPANVLFPVGTLNNYNGANFTFTTSPTTAGRIVSTFIPTNPGSNGLPQMDAGDNCETMGYAYWSFGAVNSFAGGAYTVNVYANGFPEIYDYTRLHLIRRNNGSSLWAFNGTHSAGTGSNIAPVANRTGMTMLGHYGITSSGINPLPVDLVAFNAILKNDLVNINWRTNAEVNNDYFNVERSADGKTFSTIKRVNGHGTTSTPNDYAVVDEKPLNGISYYRLTQVDYDGKKESSKIVKINRNKESENKLKIISASPSPFTDKITVEFDYPGSDDITFDVMNNQGKIFHSAPVSTNGGRSRFVYEPTGNLVSGIYILRLRSGDDVTTKKVVKN